MEQERELSVPESVLLNDLQYQLSRLPEGDEEQVFACSGSIGTSAPTR